jgi:hypothetical protein
MSKLKLSRRSLLCGATGVAIGLPWLEAMLPARARAQSDEPATSRRFVAVYQPGGTVLERWRPIGTPEAFELSPILAPLAPVKDHLVVVENLSLSCAVGEQHQAGIIALLTGGPQVLDGPSYAGSPSLDQMIAAHLRGQSNGVKPKSSLHYAVRWATGKSHGLLSPINALSFENTAPYSPIPPRIDPQKIWNELFSPLAHSAEDAAQRRARKKSILDYLDRRYARLATQLGGADRQRLEEHLGKIREIERGIDAVSMTRQACNAPTLVDTSDYNPRAGTASADDGSVIDPDTDMAIPKVGKLMMDMMVMSMACDMTSVATLQWADVEAKHTFPWLGLLQHHHYYQHDNGYQPAECEKIATWYSEQHSYLLQSMAAVDMGGHSLLDESTVFFGSEIQAPATHAKDNMPLMLAGRGGGLRTNRWLRYPNGGTHNDLLIGILRLFGNQSPTVGPPEYCSGPLAGLL